MNIEYLPKEVVSTIEGIRKTHKHHIEVKLINQRCYLYESTSVWDKERKVVRKISKYIGRIGGDGVFVEASRRIPKLESSINKERERRTPKNIYLSTKFEADILKELSTDGTLRNKELANKFGINLGRINKYRKNLETKYGIKYYSIISPNALGFTRFMVFINFFNKKPSLRELNEILLNEPMVQVGMLTNGKYHMVLFILAKDNEDLNEFINKIRSETLLRNYDSEWFISPRYVEYGMIPIRDEFISYLGGFIWKKTKLSPRPTVGQLSQREFTIIKEINKESRVKFSDIDKKYGFQKGASRYIYNKLREIGVIRSSTISIEKAYIKYLAILTLTIINSDEFKKYDEYLLTEMLGELPHINKYSYICYMDSPYGLMLVMPVLDERELKLTEEKLLRISGIKLDITIITNLFIGTFCYRKYDNTKSTMYKKLTEIKNAVRNNKK